MKRGFQDSDSGPAKQGKTQAGGSAGGSSPGKKPAQETDQAAKQAFAQLETVLENTRGRLNPPEMDWIWDDDYEEELLQEIHVALSAGVPAIKVQQAVFKVAVEQLKCIPSKFQEPFLEKVTPNADVGGQSVLHQLFQQSSPPATYDDEEKLVSLPQLLKKSPTCNLQDSNGDTVLHILVRKSMDGTYFPDDSISGVMHSGVIERWDARAKYLERAFKMLLDAGGSVEVRNKKGASVLDLLEAAKKEAQHLVDEYPCLGYKKYKLTSSGVPGLQAAGQGPVGKMVKDRQRILQALSNVIDLAKGKQSA